MVAQVVQEVVIDSNSEKDEKVREISGYQTLAKACQSVDKKRKQDQNAVRKPFA